MRSFAANGLPSSDSTHSPWQPLRPVKPAHIMMRFWCRYSTCNEAKPRQNSTGGRCSMWLSAKSCSHCVPQDHARGHADSGAGHCTHQFAQVAQGTQRSNVCDAASMEKQDLWQRTSASRHGAGIVGCARVHTCKFSMLDARSSAREPMACKSATVTSLPSFPAADLSEFVRAGADMAAAVAE